MMLLDCCSQCRKTKPTHRLITHRICDINKDTRALVTQATKARNSLFCFTGVPESSNNKFESHIRPENDSWFIRTIPVLIFLAMAEQYIWDKTK